MTILLSIDDSEFMSLDAGNGSNNNAAFLNATPTTANMAHDNSGSNGLGSSSAVQRQSSAMSTADINPAACLVEEPAPSPDSKFFPEASFVRPPLHIFSSRRQHSTLIRVGI